MLAVKGGGEERRKLGFTLQNEYSLLAKNALRLINIYKGERVFSLQVDLYLNGEKLLHSRNFQTIQKSEC